MRCLFKGEEDNGLNRQLGKPRIVFDLVFFLGVGWGEGQEWCIEGGNIERCLEWGGRGH